MAYNKTYYVANQERIRRENNFKSAQKKLRRLMLAELKGVLGIHAPLPAKAPAKPRASTKAPTYMFQIDRKPVMIYF